MPIPILEKILRDVLPYVFRVDMVGDGEIFLVPDLVKKVLEAAQAHKILVNASTNGLLLNHDTARMIVDYQLNDLNVSLDACTAKSYRSIRGADLGNVLDNIDHLNRLKQDAGSIFPRLQFSMVGMKRNIQEFPGLVALAHKHGVEAVMLQAMGEFHGVDNQSIYLRDRRTGLKWLNEARQTASQFGLSIHLWPEDQFADPGDPNPDSSECRSTQSTGTHRLKDCGFPWDVPYFAADGSVRPCCAMPPMGQLDHQHFTEIWHGESYSRLRESLLSHHPPEECVRCPGRGWYTPEACCDHLIPGIDDRQFGTGWFETESYKGESYRWARERAVFFLCGKSPGILEMDLHTVWDPGTTQEVDVQIDGGPSYRCCFKYGERRTVLLPVPKAERDHAIIHDIVLAGAVWRPVMTVPGERDPRALSVMFYGARLLPMPEAVRFANGINLIGWSVAPPEPSHVLIELYWDIPGPLPAGIGLFIHGYPATISRNPMGMLMYEIRRKFLASRTRFQLDIPLTIANRFPELTHQTCRLDIPTSVSPGDYHLFLGLVTPNGNRVPIIHCDHPTHRSSVQLAQIHTQGLS